MAIMSTFSILATAAEAVAEGSSEGGFGLNFDILETNLINLAIVIGVLFYFGRKFLGNTLSQRRSDIEEAIREAEKRQKEAAASLADAQQKLAQAQAEAERIRAKGEENAKAARESVLAAAAKDVERMKESAVQDLNSERERAIAQLRQRVVAMSMERVDSQLRGRLDQDQSAQQQLINRSIALMGGGS
ncbi:F0F1 ATP synthase subunit B [Coleofasciculus sp. LEGE 07081]|uniref:F0F1 ATP synthase subunit B n=1 Tax=unclassified Coleofasciculus TaxID=2692782 RepID=UPI00187F833A|nr:F0F1 ATP synthase subunit B [Coleofasciculus sp. LEGE 07081]MBE9148964.1 F0F1 ATP synthase subunit B [Coleofasciculus sp. LEGE 07092]